MASAVVVLVLVQSPALPPSPPAPNPPARGCRAAFTQSVRRTRRPDRIDTTAPRPDRTPRAAAIRESRRSRRGRGRAPPNPCPSRQPRLSRHSAVVCRVAVACRCLHACRFARDTPALYSSPHLGHVNTFTVSPPQSQACNRIERRASYGSDPVRGPLGRFCVRAHAYAVAACATRASCPGAGAAGPPPSSSLANTLVT